MEPHSIVASAIELWQAPVGETFPEIDAQPAGNWRKVGSFGDKSTEEGGVVFNMSETVEDITPLGSTVPVKSFRTAEGLIITVPLMDLTLEQYRLRLNMNVVQDQPAGAGQAGYKHIPLYKGAEVVERALLLRGNFSPYGVGNFQMQIYRARPEGETELTFQKGTPVTLNVSWMALYNLDAANDSEKLGKVLAQYANPTS